MKLTRKLAIIILIAMPSMSYSAQRQLYLIPSFGIEGDNLVVRVDQDAQFIVRDFFVYTFPLGSASDWIYSISRDDRVDSRALSAFSPLEIPLFRGDSDFLTPDTLYRFLMRTDKGEVAGLFMITEVPSLGQRFVLSWNN